MNKSSNLKGSAYYIAMEGIKELLQNDESLY